MKTIDQKEIIRRFKTRHGDKYDYSKTVYVNNRTLLIITCPKHGDFRQISSNHEQGKGCPKCRYETVSKKLRKSQEQFVQEAKLKHGYKYDYSKVEYVNTTTPISIICPVHGEFKQRPHNHLFYGCGRCGRTKKYSTEEFIQKANGIHEEIYDYSKTIYLENHKSVCIICKTCRQEFWQTPMNHFKGCGCPNCNLSRGEKVITKFLKLHKIHFVKQFTTDKLVNPKTQCNFYFDFFLPDYNLLIEYDGIFHFEKVYSEIKFYRTKLYDRYKNMWARHNKYELIRISYKQNLEEELNNLWLTRLKQN